MKSYFLLSLVFLFIFVQKTSIGSDDIQSIDSLLLDLSTLRAATDDFAETKMIGRGGFGMVYKVQIIQRHATLSVGYIFVDQ